MQFKPTANCLVQHIRWPRWRVCLQCWKQLQTAQTQLYKPVSLLARQGFSDWIRHLENTFLARTYRKKIWANEITIHYPEMLGHFGDDSPKKQQFFPLTRFMDHDHHWLLEPQLKPESYRALLSLGKYIEKTTNQWIMITITIEFWYVFVFFGISFARLGYQVWINSFARVM